ncbi:MAG: hypothetical protein BJ554DRAFT_7850 [Olpidium bornovanus]|uniref:Uncharacterized protein n=1 Tax=Olpidium bornovanus TaxID=278681 RepID=A0A8H7ZVI6_9FUNG|nr:MAG: hypothetical protein BJ554DRAFT_7850 [Olpidium bornovanus]
MLVGSALEPKFVDNALKKAKNPFDKSIFLGILAGFWVAVGGLAGNAVAGGMGSELRAAYPILPKIGVGFFFPFGMLVGFFFSLSAAHPPFSRSGESFASSQNADIIVCVCAQALHFILDFGGELFTGNTMVMTIETVHFFFSNQGSDPSARNQLVFGVPLKHGGLRGFGLLFWVPHESICRGALARMG